MPVLRLEGGGKRSGNAPVFFRSFFNCSPRDEILQFLVGAQSKHLFATAGGISGAHVFVHQLEKLLELERRPSRKNGHKFLCHQVGNASRE